MSTTAGLASRWFVVLNPTSGRGRAQRDRAKIERALRDHGVDAQLARSDYAGHTPVLVERALDEGFRRVLAVGGDGTVHEAVNAIVRHRAVADVTFAAIPVGTGNDWCRGLGIAPGYAGGADRCARMRTLRIDVGEARFDDGGIRYFANVAGAGFDAQVVERMPDRRFGRVAYTLGVLRVLARYRPLPMRLDDGETSGEGRRFVVFACLGGYCGGGMRVAPDASPTDGKLDVVAVGDLGKLDALVSLRRLFDGSIARHRKVRFLRTARLRIESPEPIGVEADGELIGHTPVTLSVMPAALRVVVP